MCVATPTLLWYVTRKTRCKKYYLHLLHF